MVGPETIKWLENFHFSGSIKGYREGEMFFPNSPILQVEGTFGECTLLETLLLSILNYDSAVASAASRMVSAAKDRPCMDMGGRRTNEWAAVAAARAAVVGGFKGTANLLAAQMYGLKAIGTAAHCFTLVHDDERSAFESQIAALGKNTTLLVDTYNIEEAVKTAVEVAGPELGGVRIDSGDLASLAQRVRNQLDALRSYEYSLADCEHVISGSEKQLAAYRPEEGWRDLLVDYVSNGEINSDYQGHEAIVNAHNYRAQALAELPIGAQSLMKGDPVIPTEITVL